MADFDRTTLGYSRARDDLSAAVYYNERVLTAAETVNSVAVKEAVICRMWRRQSVGWRTRSAVAESSLSRLR